MSESSYLNIMLGYLMGVAMMAFIIGFVIEQPPSIPNDLDCAEDEVVVYYEYTPSQYDSKWSCLHIDRIQD